MVLKKAFLRGEKILSLTIILNRTTISPSSCRYLHRLICTDNQKDCFILAFYFKDAYVNLTLLDNITIVRYESY